MAAYTKLCVGSRGQSFDSYKFFLLKSDGLKQPVLCTFGKFPEKCKFSTDKVHFLGHILSSQGIEADPEKLQAIVDLLPPQNEQEVRTFFGMVNQLSKFSAHLAHKTKSIRDLLHKGNQWTWGPEQQRAFQQIKADLTQVPVLALYDPTRRQKEAADASSYGRGGVVLQLQENDSWKPVSFLSTAMTPTMFSTRLKSPPSIISLHLDLPRRTNKRFLKNGIAC